MLNLTQNMRFAASLSLILLLPIASISDGHATNGPKGATVKNAKNTSVAGKVQTNSGSNQSTSKQSTSGNTVYKTLPSSPSTNDSGNATSSTSTRGNYGRLPTGNQAPSLATSNSDSSNSEGRDTGASPSSRARRGATSIGASSSASTTSDTFNDTNRLPARGQYDRVPTQAQASTTGGGNYARLPKTATSSISSASNQQPEVANGANNGSRGPISVGRAGSSVSGQANRLPPANQYQTLPTQSNASEVGSASLAPKITARTAVEKSTRRYPTLKLVSQAKKLFSNAIIKPFTALKARVAYTHQAGFDTSDPNRDDFNLAPKPNTGILGDKLGQGGNALVYRDPANPNIVHKLVRIEGPDPDTGDIRNVVPLGRNINVVNDQMAGREILNRFKQTHKGKLLDKIMEVAEVDGDPVVFAVAGRNGTHKFAHTREENISTPVYYKDSVGRALRVRDENGNSVTATNAADRIELRAKNKKRLEALAQGKNLKLKDVAVSDNELVSAITPNEELAINAVVRGLNKHGIVWTDQKMGNFDLVDDPKSPLGYKVLFFDFDGFRVVNGANSQKRAENARKLQKDYDHTSAEMPGDNQIDRQMSVFDYTAAGVGFIDQVATPHQNSSRDKYRQYNEASESGFNRELQKNTRGRVTSLWD